MFVDLCAVTVTCRGLRASTSLHVLTQDSTHPTRLKARIESEHFPFGRPAPSDADRQQALDYLFSKKAPKLKHLSGLSKRLVAIVRARSWAAPPFVVETTSFLNQTRQHLPEHGHARVCLIPVLVLPPHSHAVHLIGTGQAW